MSVQKLAQFFSVTAQHVYNQAYRHDLPFHQLGNSIRLDLGEILRHTRQRGRR